MNRMNQALINIFKLILLDYQLFDKQLVLIIAIRLRRDDHLLNYHTCKAVVI